MYIPSDSPLLQGQKRDAALAGACSDARRLATRTAMAEGRAALFQTIESPEQMACEFGIPTAVNAQIMQDASLVSRAAILSNGQDPGVTTEVSLGDLIAQAPVVVSLNAQADQVGCSNVVFSPRPAPQDAHPGIPHMAPVIRQSNMGPLYYRGAEPTFQPASALGLTGYAPSWSDAWVMSQGNGNAVPDTGVLGWIRSNPWLSLAIAAGAVLGVNEMSKRGRR